MKKHNAPIWQARPEPDPADIERLVQELGAPVEIAMLLCQRGITEPEQVRSFFSPSLNDLYDPFLMKDMEKAVDRIDQAIEKGERVMIYGDYDVDGTTSVSVVYSFFRTKFAHCEYYIPDRYKEGYGISKAGIDYAASSGISLIIALDCGIRSVDLVEYAKSIGVEFIICDHHLPGNEIPGAIAVLDPKRADCEYPFKELCGCGVGFKLIQAFCTKHNIDEEEYYKYLDLVCMAVASDIVPIIDENRVLAYFGLRLINSSPNLGLRALKELAVNKDNLSIGDLVFYIGPRINAAGRMDNANDAVELLTTSDEQRAKELAEELHKRNALRKTEDERITEAIQRKVEETPQMLERKSLVFFDPAWHKGVIGIAASRAVELYYRPTIVLTESNGVISGSGRSVKGFDLHEALGECAEQLIQFGGHMYAAGLTMAPESLNDFIEQFERVAQRNLTEEDLIPRLYYDAEIDINNVDTRFLNIINRMAPFGPGNLTPVFYSKLLKDNGYGKKIGQTGDHLRLNIIQERGSVAAVGFGMAESLEAIKKTGSFEACFQIQENIFRGERSLQLMLKALRATSDTDSIFS